MKYEDYEQYHQKGGVYVIPVEVLNELYDEMENWRDESKQLKDKIDRILEEVNYLEGLTNTCERVDINGITIYKIIKGDNNG